ncbi:MAG: hypothetical protein JNM09_27145 [Blastocatellia bacterium]|nr:hypothetical protein [Blastocatellia bacterium]
MFYRSLGFLFFIALTLCVFTMNSFAGSGNLPVTQVPPVYSKPEPLTNSTFHSDLQLPRSTAIIPVAPDALHREQLVQRLSHRLYRDRMMMSASQNPQTTTAPTAPSDATAAQPAQVPDSERFQWKSALSQAMTFLWIEHAFRFATEAGTRAELKGPFFKDWFTSIRRTRGWRDGDPMLVNYIGHPMQGSVTNYIFVHNDPQSRTLEAGFSKAYFKSRMKAMLFSTVYSTQFELGPLSEASLGNVGLMPSRTSKHPSAFVDLVVTPTLGTVWTVGEDALDRWVVKRMEEHVENRVVRLLVRGFLNPSRSFANVLRGRYPWHRDGRRL